MKMVLVVLGSLWLSPALFVVVVVVVCGHFLPVCLLAAGLGSQGPPQCQTQLKMKRCSHIPPVLVFVSALRPHRFISVAHCSVLPARRGARDAGSLV